MGTEIQNFFIPRRPNEGEGTLLRESRILMGVWVVQERIIAMFHPFDAEAVLQVLLSRWALWSRIWQANVPNKIKIFSWHFLYFYFKI